MKVNCPTCQKDVEWNDDFPERPFCSKRCRLIDLGEWASESHAIPGNPSEEELMSEQLAEIERQSFH